MLNLRVPIIVFAAVLFTRCSAPTLSDLPERAARDNVVVESKHSDPAPESTPEMPYPGKALDDVFPTQSQFNSLDRGEDKGKHMISVAGYMLEFTDFRPSVLWRNKEIALSFHPKYKDGYWSLGFGVAHLLSPNSTQIYVGNTGPGGVCCSNYWIVDISKKHPRLIFESERWGSFRDRAEIADPDNDGNYELFQFDSCFRYIHDDCGTCTPEPRVAFRFDRNTQSYLPVAGLMQDFTKQQLQQEIESLKDLAPKTNEPEEKGKDLDVRRTSLDVFDQLMHMGKEVEAWRILKKYDKPTKTDLAEIMERLARCPYYQFIHRHRHNSSKNRSTFGVPVAAARGTDLFGDVKIVSSTLRMEPGIDLLCLSEAACL